MGQLASLSAKLENECRHLVDRHQDKDPVHHLGLIQTQMGGDFYFEER
jgi:hypothetical protein